MRRQFGRAFAPDPRDANYPLAKIESTRARRRWRSRWSADQGNTPHCVGYACSRWLESDPVSQWLDPDAIYRFAQMIDEWEGTDYDGTSVRAGMKFLLECRYISAYHWPTTIDQIIGHGLEKGPVVIGVNWYRGMSDPDDYGIIVPRGPLDGGHAILIDEVNVPKELVGLNNSWGPDWGLDGRCYLHFDHLARLLAEDGEACCGVEARPNYR